MLQILPKQLDKINAHCSDTLAGEVCRIIEEFQNTEKNFNDNSTIVLLKKLIKNKIFESGRYQKRLIGQFSEGVSYFNVEFSKPADKV